MHTHAGVYSLSRNIKVIDRAVNIRGDGIGISRLVWASNAKSVGLGIVQVCFNYALFLRQIPKALAGCKSAGWELNAAVSRRARRLTNPRQSPARACTSCCAARRPGCRAT